MRPLKYAVVPREKPGSDAFVHSHCGFVVSSIFSQRQRTGSSSRNLADNDRHQGAEPITTKSVFNGK